MFWRILAAAVLLVALAGDPLSGETPGDTELNRAYQALAQKQYDEAIASFRAGIAKQPGNAGAHKDLAYTLLKTGDIYRVYARMPWLHSQCSGETKTEPPEPQHMAFMTKDFRQRAKFFEDPPTAYFPEKVEDQPHEAEGASLRWFHRRPSGGPTLPGHHWRSRAS